jgi:hypothetical protein
MKNIKEFPGYKIEINGTIWSFKVISTGKIIAPHMQKNGYLFVPLWREGKQYNRTVHRLVATHYIDNPNNLPIINHIDGNKTNNAITNLEWCTQKHNINVANRKSDKLNLVLANKIRQEYNKGNITQNELSIKYGVSRPQISHIIRNFSWCPIN